MARALADIMTELSSVYNPQRTAANEQYNQGIGAVDPQQQADLAGLEAAKKDSFGQIEQGANRRGMFYSGVPIAEQSKYVGQNYLPAVANLSNRYAQIRGNLRQSLADTLANLDVKQREFGQGIYQNEVNQDIQRQANADANTRATASNAPFQLGGAISGASGNTLGAVSIKPEDQMLYNQMFIKPDGSTWDNQSLINDYNATLASARYGNVNDQRKIQMYNSYNPQMFPAFTPGQTPAIAKTASSIITPATYSPNVNKPLFGQ